MVDISRARPSGASGSLTFLVSCVLVLSACGPPAVEQAVVGAGYDLEALTIGTSFPPDVPRGNVSGFVLTDFGALVSGWDETVFRLVDDFSETQRIPFPFEVRSPQSIRSTSTGFAVRTGERVLLLDNEGAYVDEVRVPYVSPDPGTRSFAVDSLERVFLPALSATHYLKVIDEAGIRLWGPKQQSHEVGLLGDFLRGSTSNLVVRSEYGLHVLDVANALLVRFDLTERITLQTALPSGLAEGLASYTSRHETSDPFGAYSMPVWFLSLNPDGSLLMRIANGVSEYETASAYVIDPSDHSFEPIFHVNATLRSWGAALRHDTIFQISGNMLRRYRLVRKEVRR